MSVKKVVVVGDGGCGKTSLLVVYTSNEFPETHIPTVYETHIKTVDIEDGKRVELALWDTAGEEEYDRLRPLSYARSNVVIICFSFDNPDSLQNVKNKWAPEIKHFCPNVPVILVGNKLDLRGDPKVREFLNRQKTHPVQYEEGKKIARKIKAVAYIECSAKTLVRVRDVFNKAAKFAFKNNRNRKKRCIFI